MNFLYTIRRRFDQHSYEAGFSWKQYLEWSKLAHLTELVSVDQMLNEVLVETNRDDEDDWEHMVLAGIYETGFFTTPEYVFRKAEKIEKFNLLMVVIEPDKDCRTIEIEDYDFVGYDLLDQYYEISALTNCGGFDETFSASDLNTVGLIDDYARAIDIKKQLLENNPDEDHADTNLIAIWRHRTMGR